MRILLLLLPLIMLAHLCRAQDYVAYQHTFNRIDEDVLSKDLTTAMHRLDSIYTNFDFIYAKHCIKGIQVCSKAGDSLRAAQWVGKAFRQGVPLWVLHRNTLTQKALEYTTAAAHVRNYDSLRAQHKASINTQVATQINKLLDKDQRHTRRVNDGFVLFRHTLCGLAWLHNNNKQFRKINRITDKYGFPGERLIGLSPYFDDSAIAAKNFKFDNRAIVDERAYVMLVHYYSYPGKDMEQKLLAALHTGNLQPWQYGTLNDYRVTYGKEQPGKYHLYYTWAQYDAKEPTGVINARRYNAGLNSIEQQLRNRELGKTAKKNTSKEEIVME